jgi:DsbC/DsbD-like thiol-disulfide interchange protein
VQGLHSRARLISGDRKDAEWLAGIEIALDPGFKTYWRSPGDSGLPPRFDWSGSENVKSVDIRWPAPTRSEDATGVSFVYHDAVLLPVLVEAVDPKKPVKLALHVEYGICKDICIPASADLSRLLGTPPSQHAAIEAVLRTKVPRLQEIGANGEPAILSLDPGAEEVPGFTAHLAAPGGTKPALFAEGPDGCYFSTSQADSENGVAVKLEEKPAGATGPVSLKLTVVAGEKSSESTVRLDANGKPR